MAAVISGNGLGLFNSSLNQLGHSLGGSARLGQGVNSQYVNVSNGNLLLQSRDEQLLFRGTSVAMLRTYNSQGTIAQVGGDGWLTGFERRIESSAAGKARIAMGDGSSQEFTLTSSTSTTDTYTSAAGDGAHDTLVHVKSTKGWTLTEGSTRRQEVYADHTDPVLQGRLTRITDLKSDGVTPAGWDVLYGANGNITAVRSQDTAAGIGSESIVFTRDINGRLTRINTVEDAVIRAQVNYEYDSVGRLTTVLVDLTPQDGAGNLDTWDGTTASNNDGQLYRTVYTYADASSLRIASVENSDGTLASFTYHANGRIATFTTGDLNTNDADGLGHTVSFAYDIPNRTTHVADSAGRTTSYVYDVAGQLTEVQLPAVNGLRDRTTYQYDSSGNLTREQTLRGATLVAETQYQHDTKGNVLREYRAVDPGAALDPAAATTVIRTYNANNQVITASVFTGVDRDGAGLTHPATGELKTQYIYDDRDRLRFVVDPGQGVQELEYASSGNGIGQAVKQRSYLDPYVGTYSLTALTNWATSAIKANSTLVESSYDLKGRLAQTKQYANVSATGAGIDNDNAEISNYVYDAQGLLRQKVSMRSSTTAVNDARDTKHAVSYSYDGMGRLLSEVVTEQVGAGAIKTLRATAWAYVDSQNSVRVVVEGGVIGDGLTSNDLLRTEARNSAGQVISITEGALTGGTSRVSENYYDQAGRLRASEDAAGARTYYFYDDAGNLNGMVNELGEVVAYERTLAGRLLQTVSYSTRVDTTNWLINGSVVPGTVAGIMPLASPQDRSVVSTYDGLGRLVREVDGEGGIKSFVYDGAGQLIKTTATDAVGTVATARTSRMFYDAAGRLTGILDAEGYLVEYGHDRAGRRVKETHYAAATPLSQRAAGDLASLRPATPSPHDQVTRSFYDGRGNIIATLSAESYLSEFVYDEARNQRAVLAHAEKLVGLNGSESLATLRGEVADSETRETRRTYDALGRLQVEINHEGAATRYSYDAQGRLLRTEYNYTSGNPLEVRERYARYDVFGNVVAELSGAAAAEISGSSLTESEIAALYVNYGIRHGYDSLNRRVESIDAEGNKTWYFHDSAGQQTHVVRGVADAQGVKNALGEVIETRYTAFGQMRDTTAFTGRIVIAIPGSRASASDAISVLAFVANSDSRVQLGYDRRGLMTTRLDAEGDLTTLQYSAFGDNTTAIQQIDSAHSTKTTRVFDRRGQLTSQTADADGLAALTSWTHDAFGRVVSATDANGKLTSFAFDRLGRQVSTSRVVSGRLEQSSMSYDAYARVLTQTDPTGHTTTFNYDDEGRSFTLTSAEGVSVTTVHNAYGEKVSVIDGWENEWTYQYDLDGRLVSTENPAGEVATSSYDARGLLVLQTDGSGRQTAFEYDATGRVLRKIQDPDGLTLATEFAYDGQGRRLSVTDPTGRLTTMQYDLEGRLLRTVRDPDGLNLRTTYSWDARGLQLSVTEGAGTVDAQTVSYAYDGLGRRTSQTAAPGTLDLITSFGYDANGNLISRVDAEGRVTRYAYDDTGRLVVSVDGAGGATRTWYDVAGRVVATRAYAQKINTAGLPNQVTASALLSLVTTNDALDVQRYVLYDADGRTSYSIDGAGAVQASLYDEAGRLTETTRYANAITVAAGLKAQLTQGTATEAQIEPLLATDINRDNVAWLSYDKLGRVRYTVDARGAFTASEYDGAGRLVETLSYQDFLQLDVEYEVESGLEPVSKTGRQILREGLSVELLIPQFESTSDWSPIRSTAFVYDQAGRLAYNVRTTTIVSAAFNSDPDYARGAVHAYHYDAAGLVVSEIDYGNAIQLPRSAEARAAEGGAQDWSVESVTEALLATLGGSYGILDEVPQRVTRFAYDDAGRRRFTTDAAGAVTEQRFNNVDELVEVRSYATFLPNTLDSETALVGLVAAETDYRTTDFTYDEAGRLTSKVDSRGKTESFSYDGAGLLESYTNRDNHTWTYQYDAAGRRVLEVSPQVAVSTVDAAGVISSTTRSIATRTVYDGMGNVLSRTEDADTSSARTTQYVYDNRGHQIRTIFPDAGKLNLVGQIVASGSNPTIEVTYDALGQAVVQRDVRGYYSYKAYDARGQVTFDVDASGYATRYTYNGHGDQVELRRYAAAVAISGAAPRTLEQINSLVVNDYARDRVITTTYDNRGNKAGVRQERVASEGGGQYSVGDPTKLFSYNAYGDLIREAVRHGEDYGTKFYGGELDYGPWAFTHHFYNDAGRRIQTIDPEGYATNWSHTAQGEIAEQIEYARAIEVDTFQVSSRPFNSPLAGDASTGHDRVTRWTYDALGRKSSETVVRNYQTASGQQAVRDVLTTIGYDNEGHATLLTVDGQSTATVYDALGRSVSVKEAERDVLRTDVASQLETDAALRLSNAGLYVRASPYSTMAYDAYGNVVRIQRFANGLKAGESAPVASAADAVHLSRYDWQGRNVWEKDAAGTVYAKEFDAADNLLQTSYRLEGNDGRWAEVRTANTYDASGRLATSATARHTYAGTVATGIVADSSERVVYNAFGEITAKDHRLDPLLSPEDMAAQFSYDQAGNLVRTNAQDGVWRNYGYDLAGNQVAEWHDARVGPEVVVVETLNELDLNGRLTKQYLPNIQNFAFDGETIVREYDRWGNVVEVVDARGAQTNYEYNELNQLVREVRPEVKVVQSNGTETLDRPELTWFYDALGRMVGSRDANGNERQNSYDSSGRLISAEDGTGAVSRMAYDAFGQMHLTEDALGYVSFRDFDRAGRVVAQGDYLTAQAGNTRTRSQREQYTLNQNGDRLTVVDALTNTSKYDYDSRGKVIRSRTAAGVEMVYSYDSNGNKTRETNALFDPGSQPVPAGTVATAVPILNADFEAGSLGWLLGPSDGTVQVQASGGHSGAGLRMRGIGESQDGSALMATGAPVQPNQAVSANAMVKISSGTDGTSYSMVLVWLDANGLEISRVSQAEQKKHVVGSAWRQTHFSGVAPAGAAAVKVGFYFNASNSSTTSEIWVDSVGWDLVIAEPSEETELVYRHEQTWDYNFFNRLVDHNDLSGGDYDYHYDEQTGQLLRQTNNIAPSGSYVDTPWQGGPLPNPELPTPTGATGNRELTYFANGLLKEISETTPGGINRTSYEYDVSGNRTLEETYARDALGGIKHMRSVISYDSHDRVARLVQDDVTAGRRLVDVRYGYDAMGNRRLVEAGTSYNPNGTPPPNGSFESGDSGWEFVVGEGWSIVEKTEPSHANSGNWSAKFEGTGPATITNSVRAAVQPGRVINASVMVQQGAASSGTASARVMIMWYDADGVLLQGGEGQSWSSGNDVSSGSNGQWRKSSVSAEVPPNAAFMSIAASATKQSTELLFIDDFNWNYLPEDGGEDILISHQYWYDYDAENRVTVANGRLQNGEIVVGTGDESFALSYDAAGNAFQRRFMENGTLVQEVTQFDQRGQRRAVFDAQALGSGSPVQKSDDFEYDAAGRQIRHRTFDTAGLKHIDRLAFDADGRMLTQTSYGRSADGTGSGQFVEAEGLALLSKVDYSAAAGYGYDAAGRLLGYEYHAARHETGEDTSGPIGFTHDYVYQYEARDAYIEKQVHGTSSNASFKASTSYSTYDAWGRRMAVRENTPGQSSVDDRVRYFSYDMEGNILHRREGTLVNGALVQDAAAVGQTQVYAYANGQQLASGKYNGELDIIGRLTAYDTSEIGTVRITVQAGDTLRSIAQRAYGNANLWYVIAEANAINDDSQLTAGTTVTIPEVKVSSNDAGTFKPFNPAEAIGDTSPSLPYITPPPREHCNALATILMVVVAVVVTVYTAGAATGAFTSLAAGTAGTAGAATAGTWATGLSALAGGAGGAGVAGAAVGGFAGSVAAQAVGSALGQTSFSWRDALVSGAVSGATAGYGAAVSAGKLGNALQSASWARTGSQAVAGQLTSYAASRALGLDTSFSWGTIAASAVSAALTADIGGTRVAEGGRLSGSLLNDFRGQFISGAIEATTSRLLGHGRQQWGSIAADAFGNALGNSVVYTLDARQIKSMEVGGGAEPMSVGLPLANAHHRPAWLYGQENGLPMPGGNQNAIAAIATYELGVDALRNVSSVERPQLALDSDPQYRGPDGQLYQADDLSRLTRSAIFTNTDTGESINTLPAIRAQLPTQSDLHAADYGSLYTWSLQAGVRAPQGMGRDQLSAYRHYYAERLAPAYNAYLSQAYAGDTVSSGIPRRVPSEAELTAKMNSEALLVFGGFAAASASLALPALAATLSPVAGAGLSGWSIGSGLNGLRDGDYALGALEIAAGGIGLGAAARQIRGANNVREALWLGEATAATPSLRGISASNHWLDPTSARVLAYRPSSGVMLEAQPGRTTTILGNWHNDMKSVVLELGDIKSTDFGARPGNFNVLNTPDNLFITPRQFWSQYNEIWLGAAIGRGDHFLMATRPAFDVRNLETGASVLARPGQNGMELTTFGREYLMMRRAGYTYQNGVMTK